MDKNEAVMTAGRIAMETFNRLKEAEAQRRRDYANAKLRETELLLELEQVRATIKRTKSASRYNHQ